MPRLPHSLIHRAYQKSPLLPLVLQGTHDLPSAINELRWLTEQVEASKPSCPRFARKRLLNFCKRRSRAEPLQYILGSQPFGELDIKCRPGVLIPRPETEAYTSHLASLLSDGSLDEHLSPPLLTPVLRGGKQSPHSSKQKRSLSILDVCSGSGCISLLLYSLLTRSPKFSAISTLGLDISPTAIAFSNSNLALAIHNNHILPFPRTHSQDIELNRALQGELARASHLKEHELPHWRKKQKFKGPRVLNYDPSSPVQFLEHDIFTSLPKGIGSFDIMISNPPYISQAAFKRETSRSVQKFEPKLALVPQPGAYSPMSGNRISKYLNWESRRKGDSDLAQEADIFYRQLLRIYDRSESRVLLMEVGDEAQAMRVVKLALLKKHIAQTNRVEVWRDWPDQEAQEGEEQEVTVEGRNVKVKGAGKMRAVVLFRVQEEKEVL